MDTTQNIQPSSPKRSQEELKNLQWLKTSILTLLTSEQFCALCLGKDGLLYNLDKLITLYENMTPVPLRNLVDSLFDIQIENTIPSDKICEKCTENVIQSTIFIEDTRKLFTVLDTCVKDIDSKVTDIDNELDDETDYKNSNVMIVVEYDKQTYRQVDEITTDKTAIFTDLLKRIDKAVIEKEVEKVEHKKLIIKPSLRINTKKTRTVQKVSHTVQKVSDEKKIVPNVTLKEGKLVIEPLITNSEPVAPKYNIYNCNSCSSIFTTYRSLKEHEKREHNSVTYQCRLCKKVYNTLQYLDIHYSDVHFKARCKFCQEVFDEKLYNTHLKENHKVQLHCCQYCDLVYFNLEQLETHLKSSHMKTNIIEKGRQQCMMCLTNVTTNEINKHRCRFFCSECFVMPCVHYNYLMSYREQILSRASKIRCLDCEYDTNRKELLIGHVNREHLDHHPFTCDDCGTQFYNKLSLKTHINKFHQDLRCRYCDYEFKYLQPYESHVSLCKKVVRKHSCDKCVASFDCEDELLKHVTKYHSLIFYPCTLCKKDFPDRKCLEQHHAMVHSGIQYKKRRRLIECTICNLTFKTLKNMYDHEKTHDPIQVFPCNQCSETFSSLFKVYKHKQMHFSQKCDKCLKVVSLSFKAKHDIICPGKPVSTLHECQKCGKTFQSKKVFQMHLNITHAAAKPCPHCHKKIKPSSMPNHIKVKHVGMKVEKPIMLKCQTCGYTSRRKNDLENHINKRHLKIKPYSCKICKKSFCGKIRLVDHMKTHSADNICLCPYCDKKLANKVCLKMHMRKHTGENPYECNICFQKFRTSSIMKSHRLKKHQDKTISCPLCDNKYHLVPEMRFHVKKVHWKSEEPFDFRKIVPEKFHHLFTDRRLQKLGEDSF